MMILATRSFLVFTAASDCHLKIAEETRNDAEILGCGEEWSLERNRRQLLDGGWGGKAIKKILLWAS
jgi:hypothetical protein